MLDRRVRRQPSAEIVRRWPRSQVTLTPAQARWAPQLADAVDSGAVAVHGLACWFDVEFNGSTDQRTLSTSPDQPRTHWCLLRTTYQDMAFGYHSCDVCT